MCNVSIPHDLVKDVLSRLPVKSLIRFKCVSKSWYQTIDSSEFIKTHAKRSALIESNVKLIAEGFHYKGYHLYAGDFNFLEISNGKGMEEIDYPCIMDDKGNKTNNNIRLTGSCNSLVCLVQQKETIVLWNPSTRKHIQLPICSKQRRTLTLDYTRLHGFGYDEVTDDYKVIRLVVYRDDNYTFCEYYIYSLKSNEWRSFEDFAYRNDLIWGCEGVLANGALHWLLKDHFILAFNLATEEFQVLPPPETIIKYTSLGASVVDRCQHLIYINYYHRGPSEVWVMKDYGMSESWMQLTLDLSTSMPKTLFNGVVIYDLEEQWCQKVKFPLGVALVINAKACVYFESLVRFDAGGRSDSTAVIQQRKTRKGRRKKRVKKKRHWY